MGILLVFSQYRCPHVPPGLASCASCYDGCGVVTPVSKLPTSASVGLKKPLSRAILGADREKNQKMVYQNSDKILFKIKGLLIFYMYECFVCMCIANIQ